MTARIIPFKRPQRPFNELELKQVAQLLYLTNKYTAMTLRAWVKNKHDPAASELSALGAMLINVNDEVFAMARNEPSDGSQLDRLIEAMQSLTDALKERAKHEPAEASP